MRTAHPRTTRADGFTLIELAVVILIIGILLAFVLAASASSLEAARIRATQALITKISTGLEDRIEALSSISVSPNGAHQFLAAMPVTNPPFTAAQVSGRPWGLTSEQRAQVIARMDQMRAELADVFFIDPTFPATNSLYPVNFAGLPYPADATSLNNYKLPLGNSNPSTYIPNTYDAMGNPINTGIGAGTDLIGTGINGASYAVAASLYKLIGYTPLGYDGMDNNGDTYVDDFTEGMSNPDGSSNAEARAKFDTFVSNHQHKTARAEILYAILVEGIGPFGSMFSREDFRESEIKDTDNDGVPEFVDGWGEPIQYYRAPYWHRSGGEPVTAESALNRPVLQKGDAAYGVFESRQQNPLDPNGQLVSLAWWSQNGATTPEIPSSKALSVMNYFGPLADPNWPRPATDVSRSWDRSEATGRRAYFTKFLIVSGGPDRVVGIPQITDDLIRTSSPLATSRLIVGGVTYDTSSGFTFASGEDWGVKLAPVLEEDFSLDDISSQNIQNQAGGFQ